MASKYFAINRLKHVFIIWKNISFRHKNYLYKMEQKLTKLYNNETKNNLFNIWR